MLSLQQVSPDPSPQPHTPSVQQPPGQSAGVTQTLLVLQHMFASAQDTHWPFFDV